MKSRFLLLCLFLSGCGSEGEVKDFVEKIKSEPKRAVAPLPKVKYFKPVTYNAFSIRSPFQYSTLNNYNMSSGFDSDGLDVSDFDITGNRKRGVLESYPIKSYSMHGFMRHKDMVWGLIRDPKGTVYHVEVGHYLGDSYGKVKSITEDKIIVEELLLDSKGEWHKKEAIIILSEKIKDISR